MRDEMNNKKSRSYVYSRTLQAVPSPENFCKSLGSFELQLKSPYTPPPS